MRAILLTLALLAQAPVPVEQEPRHKTVYADERLRVLEVRIPFGDTTLEHAHRYDLATVCVECADTQSREPGAEWGPVRKRTVGSAQVTRYHGRPGAHTVRTTSAGAYHLIAVENLGPGGFNLVEHTLAPGATLAGHTHPVPTVMVKVSPAAWEVVDAGIVHGLVNGPAPLRIVEIEVR
jgi:hypothetical protein